jgi:hypothetical protein
MMTMKSIWNSFLSKRLLKLVPAVVLALAVLTPAAKADTSLFVFTVTPAQILASMNVVTDANFADGACGTVKSLYSYRCGIEDMTFTPNLPNATMSLIQAPPVPGGYGPWSTCIIAGDQCIGAGAADGANWAADVMWGVNPADPYLSLITSNAGVAGRTYTSYPLLGGGSAGSLLVSQFPLGGVFSVMVSSTAPLPAVVDWTVKATLVGLHYEPGDNQHNGLLSDLGKPVDETFHYQQATTPEPASAVLFLGGSALFLGLCARRRKARLCARPK